MSRSENIYGSDTNAMADRISGEALRSGEGKEDIWGSTFDQSGSKGVKGNGDGEKAKEIHPVSNSKATSKGNH